MKRILVLVIGTIIMISGCSNTAQEDVSQNNEESYVPPPVEEEYSSASYVVDLTLDNMINYSSNIIVCEVIGIRIFDEGIMIVEAIIEDEYKGTIGSTRFEFYVNHNYSVGQRYVLFLEFFDSAVYEGRVFKPLAYAMLENERIAGYYSLNDEIPNVGQDLEKKDELKKLSTYIKKVDDGKRTNKPNVESGFIDTTDLETLVNESDFICEIVPYAQIADNPVLKYMQCKVTKNYKNEIKADISILLPSVAQVNEEYLVFLTEIDGGSYQTNSVISFIAKSDEKEYRKALQEIEKGRKAN